ncbi:MAG: TVP38/TMEM64 family protein [Patescibacteria group bacterium]
MINYLFRIRKYFLFAILLIVLFVGVYFRQAGYLNSEKILLLTTKMNESTILAPFLFILFYILLIIFFIPTLPMNLGAGFIWGVFPGGIISLIGSALGAAVSFLISRYLAHDYFNSKFNSSFWVSIRDEVGKSDWKVVAFTRVNPVFPFGLTSYFFGLSPISFKRFFISTVVFIIPPSFLFAYIGSMFSDIALSSEMPDLVQKIFIFSLLVTVTFVVNILVKRHYNIKDENNTIDSDQK